MPRWRHKTELWYGARGTPPSHTLDLERNRVAAEPGEFLDYRRAGIRWTAHGEHGSAGGRFSACEIASGSRRDIGGEPLCTHSWPQSSARMSGRPPPAGPPKAGVRSHSAGSSGHTHLFVMRVPLVSA